MGKSLIIKGADFSVNGVVDKVKSRNYIRTTQLGQKIVIPFPETLDCSKTKIISTFKYGNISRDFVLSASNSGTYATIRTGSNYLLQVNYGNSGELTKNITPHVDVTTIQEPTKITIDDVETDIIIEWGGIVNLVIFSDSAAQFGNVAIKNVKMYNSDNVLIHDFIPALYEGVACIYDIVTDTPYYANEGILNASNE